MSRTSAHTCAIQCGRTRVYRPCQHLRQRVRGACRPDVLLQMLRTQKVLRHERLAWVEDATLTAQKSATSHLRTTPAHGTEGQRLTHVDMDDVHCRQGTFRRRRTRNMRASRSSIPIKNDRTSYQPHILHHTSLTFMQSTYYPCRHREMHSIGYG